MRRLRSPRRNRQIVNPLAKQGRIALDCGLVLTYCIFSVGHTQIKESFSNSFERLSFCAIKYYAFFGNTFSSTVFARTPAAISTPPKKVRAEKPSPMRRSTAAPENTCPTKSSSET